MTKLIEIFIFLLLASIYGLYVYTQYLSSKEKEKMCNGKWHEITYLADSDNSPITRKLCVLTDKPLK